MNIKAFLNTLSTSCRTLPIVILYVTEGCNLRCYMCSYREPLPNELSLSEIESLAQTLVDAGLQHIVYSGGEPLSRRDLPDICRIFSNYDVKQTLLTNGLLLEKRLAEIQPYVSEIIVSLDGANEQTHNKIRGVESFVQILKGIRRVTESHNYCHVSIRTVLQKENFRQVLEMVELAKALHVDRISFLSADVLSNGFGRDTRGSVAPNDHITLTEEETKEFRSLIEQMVSKYENEFTKGFISDPPGRMFHIVQYYEALLGKAPFPRNHCNAPMVSAAITATGEIQPCFFLPAFGNVRNNMLNELLNNSQIQSTRSAVKEYTLERCQTCVCTLHINPVQALLDRF
ncbi:MAG: radical SAM protein [Ignavibacteriae bacterium]|nr:radical SAM protein [Ignavibacteriota bacterium]